MHNHPLARPYLLGLFILLLCWAALGAHYLAARPLLDLTDSFDFIYRARHLGPPAGSWFHPLYPLGYPLLLRGVATLVGDYAWAAKAISFGAALGVLMLFFATAVRVYGRQGLALLLTTFFAFNTAFWQVAVLDGTDMPALLPMMAALYFLAHLPGLRWQPLLYAGLCLGVSYLIRYAALAMVPAVLLTLLFLLQAGARPRLRQAVAFVAGFVLAASPQLILALAVKGNPFYNEQYVNVWFGLHGNGDFATHWMQAMQVQSLWQVIAQAPARFAENTWLNLTKVFFMQMLDYPLLFLWWLGLVLVPAVPRWRQRLGGQLLCTLAIGAAVSLAFVYWRLGLPALPGMVLVSGLAFVWVEGLTLRYVPDSARRFLPAAYAVVVIACLAATAERFIKNIGPQLAQPLSATDQARIGARQAMQAHGYGGAQQVLSLCFGQYDYANPDHPPYTRPWFYESARLDSPAKLRALIARAKPRFIVVDPLSPADVPGLAGFWPNLGLEAYARRIYAQAGVEVWVPGQP